MWPFKKKKSTDEFITWREEKLKEIIALSEKDALESFTGVYNKEEMQVENAIVYWRGGCACNPNAEEQEHFKKVQITAKKYRTYDKCGFSQQFGPFGVANFEVSRFPTSIATKVIRYQDTFEDIFAEAVKNNHYMELADDPKKLTYGFIVCRLDGIVRYCIKMSDYNSPNKIELEMMGFEVEKEQL